VSGPCEIAPSGHSASHAPQEMQSEVIVVAIEKSFLKQFFLFFSYLNLVLFYYQIELIDYVMTQKKKLL